MARCLAEEETRRAAERVVASIERGLGARTVLGTSDRRQTTEMGGQTAFWWSPSDPIERLILHSLRSHVVSCESRFPGSGEIAVRTAVSAASHWFAQTRLGRHHGEISSEVDRAIEAISSVPVTRRRLTLEEALFLIECVPGRGGRDLRECVSALPVGTSLSVKAGSQQETALVRSSGARIAVHSPPIVGEQPRLTSPKVLAFDGTIESVAQIHAVLTESNASGSHFLIVCRHSEPDVGHTVQVNNSRGTVRVSLVHSRLDDLTVGGLEDIAAYTGARIVSRESGETIASAVESSPTVKGRVWLEEGKLRISGSPASSLKAHIERLRSDMSTGDQTVRDFLTQRVSGMTADRAEVVLGRQDLAVRPTLLEEIDSRMRVLARCVESGASAGLIVPVSASPEILSLADISSAESALVPGAGQAGIIQGLRFARDLCTLGFSIWGDSAPNRSAPA